MLHEWEIYESDLPWWFFFVHWGPDTFIFQHYGSVCYGGKTIKDIPKRYRKYAIQIR